MTTLNINEICSLVNNKRLLTQALTHASYHKEHNERLEFLGDSILNCIISDLLYQQFPHADQGELSRFRAQLVSEANLSKLALDLGLDIKIRMSDGQAKNGDHQPLSILADALEALIGAVYVDRGYTLSVECVKKLFSCHLDNIAVAPKDAKTRLQECLQAQYQTVPEYKLLAIHGKSPAQNFTVSCHLTPLKITVFGTGKTKKLAEQQAAENALSAWATHQS